MTTDPDATRRPEDATERAIQIIAEALAQGLREAEVIISAERDARAQSVPPEVVSALERFGTVLSRLVDHTEQLAERMADLTEAVASLAGQHAQQGQHPTVAPPPAAKPQLPEMEPSFAPGGEGIDVTIAAVPGFQGLMEVQRALVHLAQVESAAVRRFQEDEAAIQLVLKQAMTASAIADAVTAGIGKRLYVDDARPEALRLKLRFLPA